jgi:dolichol-phosphate mannosyltransferase
MSGYFVLDRRFLEEVVHSVSAIGFKILLDLVSSATRPVKCGEIPYRFGPAAWPPLFSKTLRPRGNGI